ncbi:hypothetical protein AC578_3655 [Pseudocercospora eumusae]|uniref:Uncharacterized protein n=1 Tax=Pseudocercospora eumusae TaxID=321146 RepID=A0A139GXA0_9PEZI|nr:hypothetical protein AC578_3655 [Pseudocercospora eumusae]
MAAPPVNRRASRLRADTEPLTSDVYGQLISYHAHQGPHPTLHPGTIYQDLTQFLDGQRILPRTRDEQTTGVCAYHGILLTFNRAGVRSQKPYTDARECALAMQSRERDDPYSQILFLRGHTSPEWIKNTGAAWNVDPEFFNSTMLFRCRNLNSAYPSPPSSYPDIVRLPIVTIGRRDTGVTSRLLDKMRLSTIEQLAEYQHCLRQGKQVNLCDSIVRGLCVIDEQHFIIEQEVAVCVQLETRKDGDKGWNALISTDIANCLAEGASGGLNACWMANMGSEFNASGTRFHSTVHHSKKIAFRSRHAENVVSDMRHRHDCRCSQTASLIPLNYGHQLDARAASIDPLYAFSDLFRFVISTENQLINLLSEFVNQETGLEALIAGKLSTSNLVYCERILDARIRKMRDILNWLKSRETSRWPKITDGDTAFHKVKETINDLHVDFEHLLRSAEDLSKRYHTTMTAITNQAILAESRQALSQGSHVARLTLVASGFIPLSFTTSLFGMNVSQLGNGNPLPSIWAWVVVSVPLLALTLAFCLWPVSPERHSGAIPATRFTRVVR